MKKSSFIRSTKDKLKGFDSLKCKTALKLAASRLKLLKNKKDVQVKQMKRELAQLLESGQEQTARIRVEHVVREEKMMAAYDLIEIYCELIVARMPIVETQKMCPVDLKEAITSIIFASPRCGDVQELSDITKHFTAKYGKEFVSAAIELRPECGVSRMLVEKLSAKAPDGQAKLKILSAIAEEHNVKWDPTSFGEKDSVLPNDLLNGPNNFEKASKMQMEPTHFAYQDTHIPSSHPQMPNPPNFSENNFTSSVRSQTAVSTHSVSGTIVSSASHPEVGRSGVGTEMEVRQSFHGDVNAFSSDRKNWKMEFKDATSAAQAAAESAERASFAARAAAELSSRDSISRQHSMESQRSDIHVPRNEVRGKDDTSSKFTSETFHKGSPHKSLHDRKSGLQNEHLNTAEHDKQEKSSGELSSDYHNHGRISSSPPSLRSTSSIQSMTNFRGADGYSQEDLSEYSKDKGKKEQSNRSEVANIQTGFTENIRDFDDIKKERVGREDSIVSSRSNSRNSSTKIFPSSEHRNFGYEDEEEPFHFADRQSFQVEVPHKNSSDKASVVFDQSDSDDDDVIRFDSGPIYDEQDAKTYFPSPDRTFASHHSTNIDVQTSTYKESKSPEKSTSSEIFTDRHSSPDFSERLKTSKDVKQPDDFGSVTFDDSDGPTSDSEDDGDEFGIGATKNSENWDHGFAASSGVGNEHSASQRKESLRSSSSESDSINVNRGRSKNTEFIAHIPEEVDEEKFNQSTSGEGKELNFENLTGGLRHKTYKFNHVLPPHTRTHSSDVSLPTKAGEKGKENSNSPVVALYAVEHPADIGLTKTIETNTSSKMSSFHSDSDTDSSYEDLRRQTKNRRQRPSSQGAGREAITKSNLRGPVTYFDSDSSGPELDSPRKALSGINHFGSGISRRTKPSSPTLGTDFSKNQVVAGTEAPETSSSKSRVTANTDSPENSVPVLETKQTRRSYGSEASGEPQSRRTSSGQWTYSDELSTEKDAARSVLKPNVSLHSETRRSYDTEASGEPQSRRRSSAQRTYFDEPSTGNDASRPVLKSNVSLHSENRRSYSSEASEVPQSRRTSSGQRTYSDEPSTGKDASGPVLKSNVSLHSERSKQSTLEKPSTSQKNTEASSSDEILKASASGGNGLNREESMKKASHVHPKLPDYYTILETLRKNRK